ncbi:MAG: formate dehydrogenase accessory protein FdhE [Actinobacteria bacterium]|nr:formate dehydrogenase accessory protein FdhE [Actinomycetota bacterium]
MEIKTEDPGVKGVRKAVKDCVKRNPEFEKIIVFYGTVMEAQQKALDKIDCPVELAGEEKTRRLMDGKPLLKDEAIEVDQVQFRNLVTRICGAIDMEKPEGFSRCEELLKWGGLDPGNIEQTRMKVISGEDLNLGEGWTGEEDKLVSNLLWEAFSPYYRKYASILEIGLDQSLWQRGNCPICGANPLMGKFREEDGLWLLECSLCHSLWNVQRARCPFCRNGREGSLRYLYLDGNDRYRAQYCEGCHSYIKTIDLRDSGRGCLLPLEDLVTVELDQAAKEEGLRPASEYYMTENV